ncbi:uncharacterized protein MYCFIDRAFT_48112 [Pseudocercospora fijiensis CIRAD86]|uniref:DUF676 domain-containing protein n=1 Tax=Pseudocercospora fijiensis (strain CIRAD86) TaxID=383855 RepID=N1QAB1_PSEFD|nr:uncharacterized protein MYCFIDRAFT_48112 [Pseudocercospora fijiensis CIRAD86]EME87837.1 hypothetical protein MYCFIDRAFT_48112 [Pseudocercospora fijiensis CIRAD86]
MSSPAKKADHLAVLVHGLWGHPKHLDYLRDTLQKQYPTDRLHVLVATTLSDNKTYDGADVGGERVANEIEEEIAKLKEDGYDIMKISMVGYSFGGLISRYAIGLLYSSGLFERVKPINFTTFATPHLGVRTPKRGWRSTLFNSMGPRTLSTSGQQMFLVDSFRETGRPLLSVLSDPNSIFMKGLDTFKNKWLYANTINDRSVPWYTAAWSRTDPFVELDKIELHYLDPQPPPGEVILKPNSGFVTPKRSPYENMTFFERLKTIPHRALSNLPFYILLATLMPIFLPAFLLNSGYQTYQSAQRIAAHNSGKVFKPEKYRVKFLEDAEAVQDRLYERFTNRQREEYLPTPPPERAEEDKSSAEQSPERPDLRLSRRESARERAHDFKILALTEEQFDMIENLDKLGFEKYPVHIQKVRHTHAAIVVRMQKDSFVEGKAVVQHWAEKFEL